jgi:hypothetical protein
MSDKIEAKVDLKNTAEEITKELGLETSSSKDDKAAEKKAEAKPADKVTIGGVEYDANEVTKLVEKGKLTESIEKEQNLDIKELLPDYTRKSQLLKNQDKLRAYLTEQFGESSPEVKIKEDATKVEITDEVKAEIEKARKIGFLTKEDVDAIVSKAVEAATKQSKAEIRLEDKLTELENKYTGTAESPLPNIKFDKNKVLEYIIENFQGAKKVPDPEDIFKLMNLTEIAKTGGEKVVTTTKPPITEKAGSTGARVPEGREVPKLGDEAALRKYLEEEFTKDQVEV